MTSSDIVVTLDPRDDTEPTQSVVSARPSTLDGKIIGLFANNKPHSEELLRMITEVIRERYDIKGVVEHNKGGHQWPARVEDLAAMARRCDLAIHATAE